MGVYVTAHTAWLPPSDASEHAGEPKLPLELVANPTVPVGGATPVTVALHVLAPPTGTLLGEQTSEAVLSPGSTASMLEALPGALLTSPE
jgi:hypothetical protein